MDSLVLVKICIFLAHLILQKMPGHHVLCLFRIHLCVEDPLRLNQDDGTHGACTHTSGDHDLTLIIQLICTH